MARRYSSGGLRYRRYQAQQLRNGRIDEHVQKMGKSAAISGKYAKLSGMQSSDCPFAEGSEECDLWHYGFMTGGKFNG